MKMKFPACCAALIALFCCSCGDGLHVRREISRAESLMFSQPDSALRIMRSLDRSRIRGKALDARYALRYSQALDRNGIEVHDDSLIRPAVDYFLLHGTVEQRAASYFYLSQVHSDAGHPREAACAVVRAELFARELGEEHNDLKGLIYSEIGTRYRGMDGGDEDAERYYLKSIECFEATQNHYNLGCVHRSLAYVYGHKDTTRMFSCFAESVANFRRAGSEGALQVKNTERLERVYAYFVRDYPSDREKINTLHAVLKYDTARSMAQSSEYDCLAKLYCEMEMYDSAAFYEWRACLVADSRDEWEWKAYENLARVELTRKRYYESLYYYTMAIRLRDSVNALQQFDRSEALTYRRESEDYQHRYEVLQARQRDQRLIVVLSLALIITAFWHAVRWVRRWRHRMQAAQHAELLRRDDTIRSLESACGELEIQCAKLRAEATQGREAHFAEALEKRFFGLKQLVDNAYLYKNKPSSFFKAFTSFVSVSPNSRKEVWSDLQYVVNKKYGGVVDYLRAHYPELNARDLDLCCLLCFGFSSAGICFIYGYEDMGSLYNKRSRVRQKLGLEGLKLEDFLTGLCASLTKDAGAASSDADTEVA